MSRNLAGYLERLALEGQRDSQGSFTIDHSKALEKLSARLFADANAYLLKIVQAAVASGSPAVELRRHRDRLEVHFCSQTFSSQAMGQLELLLLEPLGSQSDRALAHFLRGLHAARARRPQALGWAVRDQVGGVGYVFQPGGLQRQNLPGRTGFGTDCVFSIYTVPGDERALLSERCLLSPVPIRWDKRPLGPQVPALSSKPLLDRIYLSQSDSRELLALPHLTQLKALVYDLGGGYKDYHSYGNTVLHQWRSYRPTSHHHLFGAPSPPDLKIVESDFFQEVFGIPAEAYALNHGGVRAGRLEGSNNGYQILYVHELDTYSRTPFKFSQGRFGQRSSPCAQAWLRCPAQPHGPSQLYVQQDGVLLDPVELELPLAGLHIYLADEKCPTDLSGLCPLQGERLKDIARWLSEEVRRAKKELRQVLRWGDKYGLSDAWLEAVFRLHNLEVDD